VYIGAFNHTIDSKGRISIPAQWRDRLLGDSRLVLAPFTVGGQRCIDIYPFAEWEKLLEKVAAKPSFSSKAIQFEMAYLGRAHPCEIDHAGRILVPQSLRKHAELDKDVVFVGNNTKFRLMERESFEKVVGGHDAEAARDPGKGIFEDLGI
jgi:MraZ protein